MYDKFIIIEFYHFWTKVRLRCIWILSLEIPWSLVVSRLNTFLLHVLIRRFVSRSVNFLLSSQACAQQTYASISVRMSKPSKRNMDQSNVLALVSSYFLENYVNPCCIHWDGLMIDTCRLQIGICMACYAWLVGRCTSVIWNNEKVRTRNCRFGSFPSKHEKYCMSYLEQHGKMELRSLTPQTSMTFTTIIIAILWVVVLMEWKLMSRMGKKCSVPLL